jgi:hypothetical protein
LKVVGALDNYSLVFVIFINFFGQLKDWVGQVLFSVSCPKGQFEKYVNVEACSPVEGEDPFIPFDNLYRQAYFVMHTFLVLSALWWPYLLHYFTHISYIAGVRKYKFIIKPHNTNLSWQFLRCYTMKTIEI